jgi:CheY-like chemotaxis protein
VSGNGRALDQNQRAAVFEAFLAKDPEKSTGAALARAYSIVREWGGDIAVSGDAIFALYLPLGTPAASPQRETILVVDDEANIRTLVAKILRRERYNVLQAGSAQEAFAVASAHEGPIHLLITDVVLPGESGRHIAERMRQSLPNLKVLYISGFSDDESVRTGNFPPGSKYLQKPFALGALISKVREALET